MLYCLPSMRPCMHTWCNGLMKAAFARTLLTLRVQVKLLCFIACNLLCSRCAGFAPQRASSVEVGNHDTILGENRLSQANNQGDIR